MRFRRFILTAVFTLASSLASAGEIPDEWFFLDEGKGAIVVFFGAYGPGGPIEVLNSTGDEIDKIEREKDKSAISEYILDPGRYRIQVFDVIKDVNVIPGNVVYIVTTATEDINAMFETKFVSLSNEHLDNRKSIEKLIVADDAKFFKPKTLSVPNKTLYFRLAGPGVRPPPETQPVLPLLHDESREEIDK